jgi:hypothetical protein
LHGFEAVQAGLNVSLAGINESIHQFDAVVSNTYMKQGGHSIGMSAQPSPITHQLSSAYPLH